MIGHFSHCLATRAMNSDTRRSRRRSSPPPRTAHGRALSQGFDRPIPAVCQIADRRIGAGEQMPHHRRPDKAHTTCQKNDHETPHPLWLFECNIIRTAHYVSSMTARRPAPVRYSSRRRNPDWSCCISACPTGIPSHPVCPSGSGYGAAPTFWKACRDPPAILPCGCRIW